MEFKTFKDEVSDFMPSLSEETVQEILEMAIHLSQNGLVSLRHKYGDPRFDNIYVNRWKENEFVLHDKVTNLYLKSYDSVNHASMQQQVMNELYRRLASADIGIGAVRHIALVEPVADSLSAVSVIETAPGRSLRHRYGNPAERRSKAWDVRSRLEQTLGVGITRVLVNDIVRSNNDGANIIEDDGGHQLLIDQPFMGHQKPYYRMKLALHHLRLQNQSLG